MGVKENSPRSGVKVTDSLPAVRCWRGKATQDRSGSEARPGSDLGATRAPRGGLLQRAQEVQQVLLLRLVELIELVDDGIGLGGLKSVVARALVRPDGREQVAGAAVMQEEDALPEAPERRRPNLVPPRLALDDIVGEPRPHLVDEEV